MSRTASPFDTSAIAVVDSRPMFRSGLKSALENTSIPFSIIEAADYEELEEKLSGQGPDILLLSASNLSDAEISSYIEKLRLKNKNCKVAMYDYRNSVHSLLPFFQGQINGYMPENFDLNDLETCIRQLANNQLYVNTEMAYDLLVTKLTDRSKKTEILSKMENTVAEYLLKGMSISKIAEAMDRKVSTISTVKANIFRKTNVDNVLDLSRVLKA